MLTRRFFVSTGLSAITAWMLAAPGTAAGEGDAAGHPVGIAGSSTGSPSTRGRLRHQTSTAAQSSVRRASGSPSRRGSLRSRESGSTQPVASVVDMVDGKTTDAAAPRP